MQYRVPFPNAGVLPGGPGPKDRAEIVGRAVDVQRGAVDAGVIGSRQLHPKVTGLHLDLSLCRIGIVPGEYPLRGDHRVAVPLTKIGRRLVRAHKKAEATLTITSLLPSGATSSADQRITLRGIKR